MGRELIIGEIYVHFKNPEMRYKVLGIAIDCDTLEERVSYEQLYESEKFPKGTIWSRRKNNFLGFNIFENGEKVERFRLLESL